MASDLKAYRKTELKFHQIAADHTNVGLEIEANENLAFHVRIHFLEFHISALVDQNTIITGRTESESKRCNQVGR